MTVNRPKSLWYSLCQNVLPWVRVRVNCVILLFFASPLCQVCAGWWTLFWGMYRLIEGTSLACYSPQWTAFYLGLRLTSLQIFLFSSHRLFIVLTEIKLSKNSVSRTIRRSDNFLPVSSIHLFFCSNHNSTRLLTQSPGAVKV